MNAMLATTPAEASSELQNNGRVRLRGPWLISGLAAWTAIFVFAFIVFALSVYILYRFDRSPCVARFSGDYRSCMEFGRGLHQLGLSFGFFAVYFLALQIGAALPYFVLSILIVRRRPNSLMALLFAMLLP